MASGSGRGSYLGFIDGDGDIPAPVLGEFVSCIQNERPDFAIGSKRHPESVVVYPRLRRLYSWGYQVLTRMLFGLNVTDTQSGIKLARREIVTELLPILEEDGFTFDLELLAVARRRGYTLVELPVEIRGAFLVHGLSDGGLGHARRRRAADMAAPARAPLRPGSRRPTTCRAATSGPPKRPVPTCPADHALGHRPEPFHDPVEASRQGLDVRGLDRRKQATRSWFSPTCGRARCLRCRWNAGSRPPERVDGLVEVDGRCDMAPLGPIGHEGPREARPLGPAVDDLGGAICT